MENIGEDSSEKDQRPGDKGEGRESLKYVSLLLARTVADTLYYPLVFLSKSMQLSSLHSFPQASSPVETRLFHHTILSQRKPTLPSRVRMPVYQSYIDVIRRAEKYRGLFKGMLLYWLINLNESSAIHKLFVPAKTWLELGYNYLGYMSFQLVLKPFRTAYTRYVLQGSLPAELTYANLLQFFRSVPIAEMYQGTTVTLVREHLFFAIYTQGMAISTLPLVALAYPLQVAETRLEAMSGDKHMHIRRYQPTQVLFKILREEGLRHGCFRGSFALAIHVSDNQALLTIHIWRFIASPSS